MDNEELVLDGNAVFKCAIDVLTKVVRSGIIGRTSSKFKILHSKFFIPLWSVHCPFNSLSMASARSSESST